MALWGKTDAEGSKPKYLSTTDKTKAFFVDVDEAVANKDIGMGTPGWSLHTTYTDSAGATRVKSEVLVPMRVTAALAGDNDALTDLLITIGTQPVDSVEDTGEAATFTVAATVAPAGSPTYQWQLDSGTGFANLSNGAGVTGATTATLTIADNTGLDGNMYRVVVSFIGAASVTSDAATLTEVTP